MPKKNVKKKRSRTFTMKAARPRARTVSPPQEILSAKDWTAAAIAWNKDGNIVILDPRLAEYIRQRARDDREFEVGIPSIATKVEKVGDGSTDYDPYPLVDRSVTQPIVDPHLNILTLCGCDYLRFHLAAEGPALHVPLSRDGLEPTQVIER